MVQENIHVKTEQQMEAYEMTFEEANGRYLGILKRISNIEDPALKEDMYSLARLTVGGALGCRIGSVRRDAELKIASLEKVLSTLEA